MTPRNLYTEDYFYWLVDLIDDGRARFYINVLEKLFATEFYSLVANDQNRISDGLRLRSKFADEIDEHLYFVLDDLPEYCTVLELMIALANRWELDIMYDPEYGDRTPTWFWLMISNLGLSDFDDKNYDDDQVSDILDRFVDRKYAHDGSDGALFVVKDSQNDFRKREIWQQINEFFLAKDII